MRVSDCMTSAPAVQIPRPGGGPRQSIGARRAAGAFFRLPRGRMLRPGLGYGPAEAGPGVIGSSSGESPGAGRSGGAAFIIHSQLRDPACIEEVGSAVAAGGEHEAGMASGELLDRVRSKRAEVDKYLEFNSRRRRCS